MGWSSRHPNQGWTYTDRTANAQLLALMTEVESGDRWPLDLFDGQQRMTIGAPLTRPDAIEARCRPRL